MSLGEVMGKVTVLECACVQYFLLFTNYTGKCLQRGESGGGEYS